MPEQFNQYTMYTYMANLSQQNELQDNRILLDIRNLEQTSGYYDVDKRVQSIFGDVNGIHTFNYPEHELQVIVYKKNSIILISAKQKDKNVFEKAWVHTNGNTPPDPENGLLQAFEEVTKTKITIKQ